MPVGAVVGSTIVGVGASVAASNSANSASRRAADAQTQASQDQIQLAREQRAEAQGLMQPYIDQGNRAQAYADALTYGSGTYGGAPAAPQTYAGGGAYDWNAYLQAYPDVAAEAQRMVSLGRFPNAQAYAQNHYETFGSSGGHQPITNAQSHAAQTPEQTVTRADVEQLIQDSAPYRYGEDEYAAQEGITDSWNWDEAISNHLGLDRNLANYDAQRGELTGIENDGYARDRASYGDERETSRARNTEQRDTGLNLAGTSRADRETVAANARTAYRGVGDENYANTVGLLDEDYLRRQGFTDAEIAAWVDQAEKERQKAIDLAASRFGVRGDVGRTERNVADITQDYAMQRALYEGGRRRADYEPYSAGRLAADAQRGGAYLDAENAYGNDLRRAADVYADDVSGAYNTYYGNEGVADTRYYDQSNARSGVNTQNLSGITNQYYGLQQGAYGRFDEAERARRASLSGQRSQNQANRTANQQNAYADYQNTLRGQSDRGYSASNAAAGYGQNYASTASNAISNSANAASQSAIARGQNAQNLYGGIAQTVGNAYGAYARQPVSQPAAANSYASLPYVQQVGAYTPYQAVRI